VSVPLQWSVDGYTVKLLRQEELDQGMLLHFAVDSALEIKRERLPSIGAMFSRKDKRKGSKVDVKQAAPVQQAPLLSGTAQGTINILVRYSRMDPVAREVVVGLYVEGKVDKGTPADAYNAMLEKLLYEAARFAVEESKRLGLN
jgi:hypothetical protein